MTEDRPVACGSQAWPRVFKRENYMPIVMQRLKGKTGPIYVCDVCGKRIEDARMAWLMWDDDAVDSEGRVSEFVVAHKTTCVPIVEKDRPTFASSSELQSIAYQLGRNLGMSLEDLKQEELSNETLRGLDPPED